MFKSGYFSVLVLLQCAFIGRGVCEKKVFGVIDSRVELHACHGHQQNVSQVEWAKFNSSNKQILYSVQNNVLCLSNCENTHFDSQNKRLILVKVTADDEGIYEEATVFSNGSIQKCNITLSLLSVFRISVSTPLSALILKCEVRGEFLKVSWFRDGLPLPENPKISFSGTEMTIDMSNPHSSHCGLYTCQVSNEAGSSEAHVNITEQPYCNWTSDRYPDDRRTDVTQILYFTGLGLIPFLVLCIIFIGICKYERLCDAALLLQEEADISRMEFLMCDFTKLKGSQQAADEEHFTEVFYTATEED